MIDPLVQIQNNHLKIFLIDKIYNTPGLPKDLEQSPIQSAHILRVYGYDSLQLTTVFLCSS